jgi:hypothetical protein
VEANPAADTASLRKGLTGAKPEDFCKWMMRALDFRHGETLDDLFPGTGIMGKVIKSFNSQAELPYA